MALFGSNSNTIAQIVPRDRCLEGFAAEFADELEDLLQRLAKLAGLRLDAVTTIEDERSGTILDVRCNGCRETIRIALEEDWYFPPSAFIAFLNARLAAAGDERELVAAHDGADEVVALCEPDEAAELRACIHAVDDGLRWPAERTDETEVGLLAAIRGAPADDDGPRLVYADWLIERGDPRGTFIMLQCQRDPVLHKEATRLLRVHAPAWTCQLPAWMRDPVFERGFVANVSATLEMLLARRAELFALTPVPHVRIDAGKEWRAEQGFATMSPDGRLLLITNGNWYLGEEFRVVELASGRELTQLTVQKPTGHGWGVDSRSIWYRTYERDETVVVQLDALV